jgi:GTPase SAR1 family protein
LHLLLIGLDQAGKSSLLECIKYMYSSSKLSPHELDLVLRKVWGLGFRV